ncbi:carboxylesterase/lipase family protein [Anaerobium acetethylicum]|nr:carboxylesterase family protein [Anaerobium acetethylicum]
MKDVVLNSYKQTIMEVPMSIVIAATKYGRIKGIEEQGYTVFKGIPYAKPPVGELRWKAPQPVESWEDIYMADCFSCKSVQENSNDGFYKKEFYGNPAYEVPISEDSLYLNICTPAEQTDEKLPVEFWIHGGAFMGGYGSEMEFDGEALCKRGVILVTINYRLNIYGFLAHPWLSAENERGISGNYGTLDQIMALQWVYENIGSFGGDRDNITVSGQSAGAMSVQTLVSSELTGNMIAKAIMQSGGSYGKGLHRDMLLEEAMKFGERFVAETGAGSLEELRGMTTEELTPAIGKFMGEMFQTGGGLVLIPNIDGYVLKDGYYSLIDRDAIKDIPYLLGSNKNDIFVTEEDLESGHKGNLFDGTIAFSQKREAFHHKPAYVYYFTRQLPGDEAGAFHSAELWYTFGTLDRCWRPVTEEDYQLSDRMLAYWTNFMKTGNPNGESLEEWKPCDSLDFYVKRFDV